MKATRGRTMTMEANGLGRRVGAVFHGAHEIRIMWCADGVEQQRGKGVSSGGELGWRGWVGTREGRNIFQERKGVEGKREENFGILAQASASTPPGQITGSLSDSKHMAHGTCGFGSSPDEPSDLTTMPMPRPCPCPCACYVHALSMCSSSDLMFDRRWKEETCETKGENEEKKSIAIIIT